MMKWMKRNIVSLTILCIAIVTLLPGRPCLGGSGELSARSKTAKLAAKLIINKLREKAEERQIDVDYLSKKMSENSGGYQERSNSWNILQREEKGNLLDWYENEVGLILKGLNRDKPPEVKDYFTEEERKDFLECPDEVIKGYLNKNFDEKYNSEGKKTIFDRARKAAVSSQWKKITEYSYPSEKEIDATVDDDGVVIDDESDKLRQTLRNRIINQQKEAIFSENQKSLYKDITKPIVDDAQKQLERQRNIVRGSDDGTGVTENSIKKHIEDKITDYQKKLKGEKTGKKIANKVYEIFPSVRKKIQLKTNDIAVKKINFAISDMEIQIKEGDIESFLKENLAAHVNKEKSWSSCWEHFKQDIANKAFNNYIGRVAKEQQNDFRAFLLKLSDRKSCQDALRALITRGLRENFNSAREKISEGQFNEFFDLLAMGSWKPTEEEIDSRYNKMSVDVAEPLQMPGISSKPFDSAILFEETLTEVQEKEKMLIANGLKALKYQMEIVENLQSKVKDEIEKMIKIPSIEGLTELYREKVEAAWSESGLAKMYENLFQRTKDDIREKTKDMLPMEIARRERIEEEERQLVLARERAEVEAEAAATAAAEAEIRRIAEEGARIGTEETRGITASGSAGTLGSISKGEKSDGGGSGDLSGQGTGPSADLLTKEGMPNLIIDLSYSKGGWFKGARILARLTFLRKPEVVEYFLKPAENANLDILRDIQKDFEKWLRNSLFRASLNDDKDVELYLITRVFNWKLCSGAIFDLRDCMKKALKNVGSQRLKIYWMDELMKGKKYKDYKNKPARPPDFPNFKERSYLIV